MSPEFEPKDVDIDAGFSHQINLEEIPENNNIHNSQQANPEYEDFIADLRSKIQESGESFKYQLEVAPDEIEEKPNYGKLKVLAEIVSKRYYNDEGTTPEGIAKQGDMKLLLFELITNMYRYDPNGTKIVTIEGDFKDRRRLWLYGRGDGPDVENQKGINVKKLKDNLFEIKPGPEKDALQILEEIDKGSFKDVQHGRGLEMIAKEAESDHLSVAIEKRPEGEEPSYVYTVLDTPDHEVNVSDLEKVAA